MDKIQVPVTFNLQKRSAYKRHSTYEIIQHMTKVLDT